MAINENDLRKAGFTERDVENLQHRLNHGGGTMEDLIAALSRRFQVSAWVTVALVIVMLAIALGGDQDQLLSGGVSSFIVLAIGWGTFPPLLAWKARQLKKSIARQA